MNAIEQLTAKPNYQTDYATLEQTLWADVQSNEPMRLHCNEMPFDLPQHLKAQLTTKMADLTWNSLS